jgi:hypothetical protein
VTAVGDKGSAFVKGGCGCLGAFLAVGLIVLIVGGQVHIDLFGAICLFVCGGLIGLIVLWIYNKGRHDGGPPEPPGPPYGDL